MPAIRNTISASPVSTLVRIKWESRTAAFTNGSVQSVIDKARAHFRLTEPEDEYVLLGDVDGDELELTDDAMKLIGKKSVIKLQKLVPQVSDVPLGSRDGSTHRRWLEGDVGLISPSSSAPLHSVVSRASPPPQHVMSPSHNNGITFKVARWGEEIRFRGYRSLTISRLTDKVARHLGVCSDDITLLYDGARVAEHETLMSLDVRDDDTFDVMTKVYGGKPVIYLFPPTSTSATVAIRLVSEWSFSHIYPLASERALSDGRREVSWRVSAEPDGSLTEEATGLHLSYLFWEAVNNPTVPPSPPASPGLLAGTVSAEHFNPAYPSLEPSSPTAVLLPFTELLPYLDRVLKMLALHTSARNDFITYWLPALSKQPYVALRFLPQPSYEQAAELEVLPVPDVVTRVFMLFRGVAVDELEAWAAAHARVGLVDWASVVGVKVEAWDVGRFRVLEWGAMEVL